jgi:hypothetical protein
MVVVLGGSKMKPAPPLPQLQLLLAQQLVVLRAYAGLFS